MRGIQFELGREQIINEKKNEEETKNKTELRRHRVNRALTVGYKCCVCVCARLSEYVSV